MSNQRRSGRRAPRLPEAGENAETSTRARLIHQSAVHAQDVRYIVERLGEGRNASAIALDSLFARVVRGKRKCEIAAVAPEQIAAIA